MHDVFNIFLHRREALRQNVLVCNKAYKFFVFLINDGKPRMFFAKYYFYYTAKRCFWSNIIYLFLHDIQNFHLRNPLVEYISLNKKKQVFLTLTFSFSESIFYFSFATILNLKEAQELLNSV